MQIGDAQLDRVMPALCNEIRLLKASYFSRTGKPGANWNPLKPDTIKRKVANKYLFNIEMGDLKKSLTVTYELLSNQILISCEATHKKGDAAINGLIYEYGRDFLNFTIDEAEFIVRRLQELLKE